RLRDRRHVSAAVLTVGVVVLILTPLTIIGIVAIRQAIETTSWVRGALARGGVHELLRPLPDNIERWLSGVFDRVPRQIKMLPQFFGLLTLLTSFIPSVGTAIVSLPLAGLLLLLGHPWAALFLALWAVLFVGTVDNLVRPMLIKGDINVHGALVFFAIIGGIS